MWLFLARWYSLGFLSCFYSLHDMPAKPSWIHVEVAVSTQHYRLETKAVVF